jgi:MFS superfamily sulfate permease-like transporter
LGPPCTHATLAGIIVIVAGKFYQGQLKIVGTIPAGLPPLTIAKWAPIENVPGMMRLAFIVMIVDLLESTSIARCDARARGGGASWACR